jgi:hypothetical protein
MILSFFLRLRYISVMMDQLKNSTRRMGHALTIEGNARDLYALFIARLRCRYILKGYLTHFVHIK